MARLKSTGQATVTVGSPKRRSELELLLRADLAAKHNVLLAEDKELAAVLEDPPLEWVGLDEFYDIREAEGETHGEVMTRIGDHCRRSGPSDWARLALTEATYGMTSDYDCVWYLLTPLMQMSYDAEPAVSLRKNGVLRIFTKTRVVAADLTLEV